MLNTKVIYSLASNRNKDSSYISIYANYSSLKNLQQIVKSHLRLKEIDISDHIKKHILSTGITRGSIAIFYTNSKTVKLINLDQEIEDSYYKGNLFNLLPLYNYYAKRPRFSLAIISKNKTVIYEFKNEELSEIENLFRESKDYKDNSAYLNLSVGAGGGLKDKKSKYDSLEYDYYTSISKDLLKYNKAKNIKYSVVLSSIKLESYIQELFGAIHSNILFAQFDAKRSENEIIKECLNLINKAKSKSDKIFIHDVIELNYPINKIAINSSDIINAVNEKKVETLFIRSKVKQKPGFQCSKCDYLSHDGDMACTYCASEMIYYDNINLNILNTSINNKSEIHTFDTKPKLIKDKDLFVLKIY